MNKGWVCLHRKLLDWEWFQEPKMVQFYTYCILRANFEDTQYKGISLKKGDFICTIPTFEKDLGLSAQEVRTCIKRLKSTGSLTDKITGKIRIISLCNYSDFQENKNDANRETNRETNRQLTGKQQANNRQLTADNNITIKQINNSTKQTNKIYTAGFEEFWKQYPKKAGKAAAFKAYEKALKNADHLEIMQGVMIYAQQQTDPQFIKHPQGWLNDERWKDDFTHQPSQNGGYGNGNKKPSVTDQIRDAAQEFNEYLDEKYGSDPIH